MGGLEIAAIITAVGGLGTVVIALLRGRREDTGMMVEQQAEIVSGMRSLNEELRTAYDRLKVVVECLEEKALVAAAELREEAAELKEVHEALGRALKKIEDLEALANGGPPPPPEEDREALANGKK